MFSYNMEPKPTSSSDNDDHTQFLPFVLTFQPEISKYIKKLKEQGNDYPVSTASVHILPYLLHLSISLSISTPLFLYLYKC